MKLTLDFRNKSKTADTLQNLRLSVNALRGGYATANAVELIILAVEDYIKLKKSQTGRPPIYETAEARREARMAQNNAANAKRRGKKEKQKI